MTAGGKREGAGRKPLPKHLKRLPRCFYLTEEEYKKAKELIECLKLKRNQKKI